MVQERCQLIHTHELNLSETAVTNCHCFDSLLTGSKKERH
jgi:hypothetical protein